MLRSQDFRKFRVERSEKEQECSKNRGRMHTALGTRAAMHNWICNPCCVQAMLSAHVTSYHKDKMWSVYALRDQVCRVKLGTYFSSSIDSL